MRSKGAPAILLANPEDLSAAVLIPARLGPARGVAEMAAAQSAAEAEGLITGRTALPVMPDSRGNGGRSAQSLTTESLRACYLGTLIRNSLRYAETRNDRLRPDLNYSTRQASKPTRYIWIR
jgi:hypothetical protein